MNNPWHFLPQSEPYVLPDDAALVDCFNAKATIKRFLHLNILPEPFVGNPAAPVVVLGNNPGYSEKGLGLRGDSVFMCRMRNNLLHAPSDCPFLYLDPAFSGPSKKWWESKFKHLLRHFGNDVVARSILAVEFFPYSSQRYGHGRLPLPSQQYNFHLVRSAIARRAVVVLTRGEKRWLKAVPELDSYGRFFRLKNKQKSSLSPNNCPGFSEVVRAIELTLTGSGK